MDGRKKVYPAYPAMTSHAHHMRYKSEAHQFDLVSQILVKWIKLLLLFILSLLLRCHTVSQLPRVLLELFPVLTRDRSEL